MPWVLVCFAVLGQKNGLNLKCLVLGRKRSEKARAWWKKQVLGAWSKNAGRIAGA